MSTEDEAPGGAEILEWHQAIAAPFPVRWRGILAGQVPFYRGLGEEERRRLEDRIKVFVYTKSFSSPNQLAVTEEMKVVVAATACRLTMNMPWEDYAQVRRVSVRAGEFTGRSGKAVIGRGGRWKVVVSWPDLVAGLAEPDDGDNVGYHEFAHALDGADGDLDGEAPGPVSDIYQVWTEVMSSGREEVVCALRENIDSPIDGYAAKSDSEFFAVATEWFFERPDELRERLPAVYDVLSRFYRQDPVAPVAPETDDESPGR